MSVKMKEPGVFETSYRLFHRLTKRDNKEAVRVIVEIRRAAIVAQIKRMQKGGK
jgi:hypothetical protein